MLDLFRRLKGSYVGKEEERVLAAIDESGLKSMRVVGRGTLMVDPLEVARSDVFKKYSEKAKNLVKNR